MKLLLTHGIKIWIRKSRQVGDITSKKTTAFDTNGGNARNTPRVPWRCRFAFDIFSGGDCGSIAFKALLPGAVLIGGMAMSKYRPNTRQTIGSRVKKIRPGPLIGYPNGEKRKQSPRRLFCQNKQHNYVWKRSLRNCSGGPWDGVQDGNVGAGVAA